MTRALLLLGIAPWALLLDGCRKLSQAPRLGGWEDFLMAATCAQLACLALALFMMMGRTE